MTMGRRYGGCVVGLAVAVLLAVFAAGDDRPPVAPVRPVVDDYFGVKVTDNYRYFENFTDPEVQAWVKGQAEYASRVLRAIPGRDRLLARIKELDEGAPYHVSVVHRWPDGAMHYMKQLASEDVAKLYYRDGKEGAAERLLVDPERFREPGAKVHYSLSFARPSPDRRYVAYGIAASGSEETTLRVLDVRAGKDLPEDVIDRMEFEYLPPCWLADSSGFTYGRRRKLPEGTAATEKYKRSASHVHRIGTEPDKDPVIFSMETAPALGMAETDFPAVAITMGSDYAIGQVKHGDETKITLYAAPVASLGKPDAAWKKVCDVDDEVTEFGVHGDDVYLLTSAGAPRFKIVRTSIRAPGFAKAETVIAESAAVVQRLGVAKDALYVESLDAGLNRTARVPFGGSKVQAIDAPEGGGSVSSFGANPDVEGAFIHVSSWVRGGRDYLFDPAAGRLTDAQLEPRGKFDDLAGFEAEEVLVPSHDRVRVPLSILHKSGISLDGSYPTLVSGYGAYGMTMSPHFRSVQLAWLERGGVLAFAHVRGGGEFGRDWHLAGRKATKPNTWKDFIACCEYLVNQKYTSPAKLAGAGGSAGGILIGRAFTERPDLFAAVIDQVGCSDSLRFETTTNGVPNIPEFGSVTSKEEFDGLYEMSTYAHVKDGVKYPGVLLIHGINDPRVEPWESAKMTARLQAATASGKPVLFRVDYDAGHGIGSTKTQWQETLADEWAFLLWQMGEEGFAGK
jgi:prolyl oligopeptidase